MRENEKRTEKKCEREMREVHLVLDVHGRRQQDLIAAVEEFLRLRALRWVLDHRLRAAEL